MSSSGFLPRLRPLLVCALVAAAGHALVAQAGRTTPKFYPDDPLLSDNDTALDASGFVEVELSEAWDFLINTFTSPGQQPSNQRAVNVNTMDEVPDSSWFSNRIGIREMPISEIVRGPLK